MPLLLDISPTGIPRSGELARCTILNQSDDIPVDKLFGTVILERVIDTLMLGSLLGLAFVLNVDVVDTFFQELTGFDDPSDGGSPAVVPARRCSARRNPFAGAVEAYFA